MHKLPLFLKQYRIIFNPQNKQIIMKKAKADISKLSPEQIIGYCQQNFINIVPNTCSGNAEKPRTQPTETHH